VREKYNWSNIKQIETYCPSAITTTATTPTATTLNFINVDESFTCHSNFLLFSVRLSSIHFFDTFLPSNKKNCSFLLSGNLINKTCSSTLLVPMSLWKQSNIFYNFHVKPMQWLLKVRQLKFTSFDRVSFQHYWCL
jgi:hypothetical protein